MKRSRIELGSSSSVESYRDMNGRVFIAHANGCSMFFTHVPDLRRFLRIATKTPSSDALNAWLGELDAKAVTDPTAGPTDPTAELQTTGFGPECHDGSLDATDPNHNTRMVT